MAVVVSRKVEKSAVGRNRLRRRLYEAVRALEGNIDGPYDIVFTVFSNDLLAESAQALNRQVKGQLSAAGIIAKKTK